LLKNVFLDARGYKSMYGLAAIGAFAGFGSRDVARNGFEKIDRSLAQVRDKLRKGNRLAFAPSMDRCHEIGRDDEFERFGTNARTISDDEIAKAEQRFVFLPHRDVEEGINTDHEEDAITRIGMAEIADRVHGIV